MNKIGVVEGFFGMAWPEADRLSYASFLADSGGGFYIYAPKRDPHLRKQWRAPWTADYLAWIAGMASHFKKHGVSFGVGLSPFGLGQSLEQDDRSLLQTKLAALQTAGVEVLGLFFDDMPSDHALAQTQLACIRLVQEKFSGKVVFCPSYYTPDPILEKVFGNMPEGYWEDISAAPADVSMAWTGPRVISTEISVQHVQEFTQKLKRPLFLWENVFANDGPKNCKFLKLKPFSGREAGVFDLTEAFAFNMMNQPQLSKILFLAARSVLEHQTEPEAAFEAAVEKLCTPAFGEFLRRHRALYLEQGLDNLTASAKQEHCDQLATMGDAMALEVIAWLQGAYVVGPECLTD